MKVFMDTNILIDVLEARSDYRSSLIILQLGMDGKIQLCASDISFVNIAYISRKAVGMDGIYDFFTFIRRFVEVIPVGEKPIDDATMARHKDFEDYVQYAAAKECGADCIVTRNIKDFLSLEMNVLRPNEFLQRIGIQKS